MARLSNALPAIGAARLRMTRPVLWILSLLVFGGAALAIPAEQFPIGAPALASVYIFFAFSVLLVSKVGDNAFGEVGFLYLALGLAYTVLPAAFFMALGLETSEGTAWERLAILLPEATELGRHLWRHVLFLFGVAVGYLLVRRRMTAKQAAVPAPHRAHPMVVAFLMVLILVSIGITTLLSAPTESYIDHYTRYDHLSAGPKMVVHLFFLLKTAAYYILIAIMFRDYRRYRWLILVAVVAICGYETVYSFGSRILTLTIILAAVCMYHYKVRKVTLRQGAVGFLAIATLFSAIELFRSLEFDLSAAREAVSTEGAGPAAEFGAVFFTSFHLYSEREQGALPPRELPMFFNDVLSLIPFVDHVDWHPQYWYARHYFPDAAVPPETMGPIADSALWGGEVDLLFRSLLSGALYGWLMNWYLRRQTRWWASVIYAYCFATCVMTLKYSILYPLGLLKILLPGMLVLWAFNRLFVRSRL